MIVVPPLRRTHGRRCSSRICECHNNHNYCININGAPKQEIFPAEGTAGRGKKIKEAARRRYTFTGLRETVPEALNSVSPTTIHRHYLHCVRTIDAYAVGEVRDGGVQGAGL